MRETTRALRLRIRASSLAVAAALAACATQTSADFAERVRGERVYGMIVSMQDVPDRDVLSSAACIRRDVACALELRTKSYQYASLAVYGGNVVSQIRVPRSMGFGPGDILQIEISPNPDRPSEFTAMGARSHQRGAECDWVDGSPSERRGGVNCFGWTYKALLSDR